MSETYTKLFTSITASTVWQEPAGTRLTWITLLAMADQNGEVYASVPGLARIANVPREEVECALRCFLGPDPDSRTKEHDGRRIQEIDGGWRLLNHSKFHAIRMEAERAAYKREWDRKNRPSGGARKAEAASPTLPRKSPTHSDTPTLSDRPDPPDQTILEEQRSKSLVRQVGRFDEFWAAYPNKTGKKPCQAKWQSRHLDQIADRIIADVRARVASDRRWQDGFVPNPETYLNQDRWNDEIQRRPNGANGTPSKTLAGMQALQGMKSGNGLVSRRDSGRTDETYVLVAGPDAGFRHDPDDGSDLG